MNKKILPGLIVILFCVSIMIAYCNAWGADTTTKVTAFNGEVSVTIIKDGKPTQERVVLKPGEAVVSQVTLQKISLEKALIDWKDVAQYESSLVALAKDLFERLYIDNLWAARMNWIIEEMEKRRGITPTLDSVRESLGIPKDRPSGIGVYEYIPGPNGPNPSRGSRVPYVDKNLNMYLDASNAIKYSVAATVAQEQVRKESSPSG